MAGSEGATSPARLGGHGAPCGGARGAGAVEGAGEVTAQGPRLTSSSQTPGAPGGVHAPSPARARTRCGPGSVPQRRRRRPRGPACASSLCVSDALTSAPSDPGFLQQGPSKTERHHSLPSITRLRGWHLVRRTGFQAEDATAAPWGRFVLCPWSLSVGRAAPAAPAQPARSPGPPRGAAGAEASWGLKVRKGEPVVV